ncbi:MAG: TIGR02270 family protein [Polyangiaceae bacterium]
MTEVLDDVLDAHAAEVAACWSLRHAAVVSPAYDLAELALLDDRLERHREGLAIAGDRGWEACERALEGEDPGEVFAAGSIALETSNWVRFGRALDARGHEPDAARALVSAIGWAPLSRVALAIDALLDPDVPHALHFLGIAGCAVHRHDPGPHLDALLHSATARVRARALRAVGELARVDLAAAVREALSDDDEPCRFWAAHSLAALRDERANDALRSIARSASPLAERAAEMLARRLSAEGARELFETLLSEGRPRAAIIAAGASGRSGLVPLLLEHAAIDDTARLAAWSISLVTNAGATRALHARAPANFRAGPSDDPADEDVAMDPDEDLPWLSADALRAWWTAHAAEFAIDKRYLLGRPVEQPWLQHLLLHANQAVRGAAAIELQFVARDRPRFAVGAPGFHQRLQLAS